MIYSLLNCWKVWKSSTKILVEKKDINIFNFSITNLREFITQFKDENENAKKSLKWWTRFYFNKLNWYFC